MHDHSHAHAHPPILSRENFSLLRLSAARRLALALLALVALWGGVYWALA